jgi:hypothetical protein
MSLSSCSTTPGTAETDACLRPDPGAVEPEVPILPAVRAILRLSIRKEESGLRDFPSGSDGTTLSEAKALSHHGRLDWVVAL